MEENGNGNGNGKVGLAVAKNDIEHIKGELALIRESLKELPCLACIERVNEVEVQLAEVRTEVHVRSGVVSTVVSMIAALVTYLVGKG